MPGPIETLLCKNVSDWGIENHHADARLGSGWGQILHGMGSPLLKEGGGVQEEGLERSV